MSADLPDDDDPTRALDDFVRRMRPTMRPPTEVPDLSDLKAKLNPQHHSAAPRARPSALRGPRPWVNDDVVDITEVQLQRVAPAAPELPELHLPTVDLDAEAAALSFTPELDLHNLASRPLPAPSVVELEDTVRQASDFAHSQWDIDDQAAAVPVWQPDADTLHHKRPRHPRILSSWQPGAWIGAVREVFDSTTEFINTPSGPAVETYPPHRLLLLWTPHAEGEPPLMRWPQVAHLSAVPEDDASEALLALLPDKALLWVQSNPAGIDWALAADLVLHHEPELRDFQLNGLRAFIDAQRQADFALLNDQYAQAEPGGAVVLKITD